MRYVRSQHIHAQQDDGYSLIEQLNILCQIVRHSPLTNTFRDGAALSFSEFRSPTLNMSKQHRPRWIRQEALNTPVTRFLEIASNAGQCTARASRTGEAIEVGSILRLLPDLRTSRLYMRLTVRDIVKLVRPVRILQLVCVSLGLVVVVLRVLKRNSYSGIAQFSVTTSAKRSNATHLAQGIPPLPTFAEDRSSLDFVSVGQVVISYNLSIAYQLLRLAYR